VKHCHLPFEKKKGFSWSSTCIGELSEYEKYQLSFHPERPRSADYLEVFDGQEECLEDTLFGSRTIQTHRAELRSGDKRHKIMLIGQQSAPTSDFERLQEIMKDPEEMTAWNNGMPTPAAFVKALRAIQLAEAENRIIITLIDTPGADPTEESEAGGIAWKIGRCMQALAEVTVPTISVIINRGCSGGAIALSGCDRVLAMQYATYLVISPEACSSILFHTRDKAALAAEISQITAEEALHHGIIDKLIPEPEGPAHRFRAATLRSFHAALFNTAEQLAPTPRQSIFPNRVKRWSAIGRWENLSPESLALFEKKVSTRFTPPENNRFVLRHKGCRNSEGKRVFDPILFSALQSGNFRCEECGHRYQRLSAHDYCDLILDAGSFSEDPRTRFIADSDILNFPGYKEKLVEARKKTGTATALITGTGTIEGTGVVFCAANFGFLGGSFSMASGEKLFRAAEQALRLHYPLIIHATGGGARMHEGCSSMVSIPKVHVALSRVEHSGLPLVTIIADPMLGGLAIGAGSRGVHIIEHNAGNIGFSGRRVIEQYTGQPTSKAFQTARWLQERGFAARIAHPHDMKNELLRIIRQTTEKQQQ